MISALGVGVGMLAFVTAVGGATLTAQLRGVGLSGSDGVSLIPRGRLLTSGADAVLFVLVVAALAIAILYATARWTQPRRLLLSLGTFIVGLAFYIWKAGDA